MSKFVPGADGVLETFLKEFEINVTASPLHDEFGIILKLDESLTTAASKMWWVRSLVEKYGVVVFKNQRDLIENPRDYIEVVTHLVGKPQVDQMEDITTLEGFPEIQVLGSVSHPEEHKSSSHPPPTYIPARAPESPESLDQWLQHRIPCSVTDWHSDEPWLERPVKFAIALCALSTGPNATLFSSTEALYERVDESIQKKLQDTKTTFAPPPWLPCEAGMKASHPTVHNCPHGTSFYICVDSMEHLTGMYLGDAMELIWELTKDCARPEHVYTHQWEEGDMVIWDNTRTLHARTPYSVEGTDRILYRMRLLKEL
mmetsp:Transcript_13298/g.28214  ORF Transcript_13298/g.28214 Transcript_13298/m.28214 type:complete len:315 (+) Transcript_13298:62-1006(+)